MKIMPIFWALAAAPLAPTILAPAAIASEPVQPLRISLDGLDLATPGGMNSAQRRIDRAVSDFCRNDVEHLSQKARRTARQCRESARGAALAQLDDRRLRQLAAR
jgi:UrcA family protein